MFAETVIVLPVLPTKVLNSESYSVTVSCIISCLLHGAPLAFAREWPLVHCGLWSELWGFFLPIGSTVL